MKSKPSCITGEPKFRYLGCHGCGSIEAVDVQYHMYWLPIEDVYQKALCKKIRPQCK